MEEKEYIENDHELEEQDYFQREEQKRIKEELDALLKETNPLLNNDRKLTAEELENFYSLTARRRKKKRQSLRKKIRNFAVIGIGAFLIVAIMWMTFNWLQALFYNRENELTQSNKQQLEALNTQIDDLKKENQELSSENLRLKSEIEELKSQIQEQSLIISQESSESSKTESSKTNEKNEAESVKAAQAPQVTYYTVQDGDTLWKISTKLYGNGRYYKNIMNYNHLKSENDLIKGMKLAIPKL